MHRSRKLSPPPAPDAASSGAIVDALCEADARFAARAGGRRELPSPAAVRNLVDDLQTLLFPRHNGAAGLDGPALRRFVSQLLDRTSHVLEEQAARSLAFVCRHTSASPRCATCRRDAADVVDSFVARLPLIRSLLEDDVSAAFDGDPAAQFVDETLLCYPGVAALVHHRVAHELHRLGLPVLPRIIAEQARAATGIDIHPGATIGPRFFIDHGGGVVIGETCRIGARVRIYQGVTLGARGFPTDQTGRPIKGRPRHPIVEDDVVIYAGATILGRITIGRGATVGGNVWVTRSVPAGARVTQAQLRQDAFLGGSGI